MKCVYLWHVVIRINDENWVVSKVTKRHLNFQFLFYFLSSYSTTQSYRVSLARWVALGTTQLLCHLFSVTLWLRNRVTHVLPTTPSEIQDNCISQHLYCWVKTFSGPKPVWFLPIFQDSQQSLASTGLILCLLPSMCNPRGHSSRFSKLAGC